MRKFQLANVTSPSIEFEIGGHILSSGVIKNTKKNPNYDEPLLFFDVVNIIWYIYVYMCIYLCIDIYTH